LSRGGRKRNHVENLFFPTVVSKESKRADDLPIIFDSDKFHKRKRNIGLFLLSNSIGFDDESSG